VLGKPNRRAGYDRPGGEEVAMPTCYRSSMTALLKFRESRVMMYLPSGEVAWRPALKMMPLDVRT